ncbi:MAG: sigma 54-interacting transcriptional regulator [Phycisphaeraceae bacterium]|jgi:Nif-specific regulatory protein
MDRSEQELNIIEQISQILGGGLELSEVFQRAMALLERELSIEKAALTLLDPAAGQLSIVASIGLTPEEQRRGRYAVGEGVSGHVLETGQAEIIPDVSKHKAFLNRTQTADTNPDAEHPHSYICLPVFDGLSAVGTIGVLKRFTDEATLQADARLLKIFAGLIAQTIRIHQQIRLQRDQWLEEKQQLTDDLRKRYTFDNIIGSSPAMLDVLGTIAQVATSRATCLILGETGCGKELIAKAIHYNSPRKDKPLIRVNCGALSPQLLESELFGHMKGAFTGALRDKIGRFEAADGGTIFLDEVGTLDPQLQVKLLRVLQEREFERVGDHRTIKVDCRVIAATNLNLENEVRAGTFREDLFYRLNVVTILLPPLRSRREDIPSLIDHFLQRYNKENARNVHKISRDVMTTLLRYPWPGNVRELENAIERAVVLSNGEELTLELLPLQVRMFAEQTRGEVADESIEALCGKLAEHAVKQLQVYDGQVYDMVVGEVERQLIRESLNYCGGVKLRAADFLGINRNTLNKKVKDLKVLA